MTDFYPLRHHRFNRDIRLLKQLEIKHNQLEEKILNEKKIHEAKKFVAHPKSFESEDSDDDDDDDDTATSSTPRLPKAKFNQRSSKSASNFSSSSNNVEDTKQRAQNFHKLLHEKLSLIDHHPSQRSDFSNIGDSFKNSQQTLYQNKTSQSNSSIASSSLLGSEIEYLHHCKNRKFNKNEINNSVGSKTSKCATEKNNSYSSRTSFCANKNEISSAVFEKKFKSVVTKSLKNIANIKKIFEKGILPPDGEEDETKRRIRAKEFINRFSRNYLYSLGRQMRDLKNYLNSQFANQKLLSIYQIIQNALQTYESYLPISIGEYQQLIILMENIVEISFVHKKLLKIDEENYLMDFIDTFKLNAELIVQKVKEFTSNKPIKKVSSDTDALMVNRSESSKSSVNKIHNKKNPNCGKKNKLFMYTVTASFRKDARWRKTVENLAKKKFNVQSKYKTATFKHRPPLQKEPEIISFPNNKFNKSLIHAKPSEFLKISRVSTPVNEDDIQTLVEEEKNKENVENNSLIISAKDDKNDSNNKEALLMKMLQLTLLDSHNSEEEKSKLNQILLSLMGTEENNEQINLQQFVQNLAAKSLINEEKLNEEHQHQQLSLEIVKSHYSLADGIVGPNKIQENRKKEPKITITGEKNTRLICITDENSIIEPSLKESQSDNNEKPQNLLNKKVSSETQTDIKGTCKKSTKSTQKGKHSPNIKISRINKPEALLKPLNNQQALNAIQYKLDFYRYCKKNPMYKKSTTCQPWTLMSKISEDVLNECFLVVAREIELNDIVDKVFQAELQM